MGKVFWKCRVDRPGREKEKEKEKEGKGREPKDKRKRKELEIVDYRMNISNSLVLFIQT